MKIAIKATNTKYKDPGVYCDWISDGLLVEKVYEDGGAISMLLDEKEAHEIYLAIYNKYEKESGEGS